MLDHQAATTIAAQRRAELRSQAIECRRTPARRFIPHWNVTWSRARLSPVAAKGSALVIVISAKRLA